MPKENKDYNDNKAINIIVQKEKNMVAAGVMILRQLLFQKIKLYYIYYKNIFKTENGVHTTSEM